MAETSKCDCASAKKVKALEKQLTEVLEKVERLERKLTTLEKAVRR